MNDQMQLEVEEAWREEVERRVAELDSGAAETIPWEIVEAKLLRPTESGDFFAVQNRNSQTES